MAKKFGDCDSIRYLTSMQIDLASDFYALRSSAVQEVLIAANAAKYRKPKNANGSRARYYFQRLQRAARKCK